MCDFLSRDTSRNLQRRQIENFSLLFAGRKWKNAVQEPDENQTDSSSIDSKEHHDKEDVYDGSKALDGWMTNLCKEE